LAVSAGRAIAREGGTEAKYSGTTLTTVDCRKSYLNSASALKVAVGFGKEHVKSKAISRALRLG